MSVRILPLLISGFITISFADSAVQTDWSGGPGVVGPVITLGSEFLLDTDVFCGNPFDLVLQIGLEHTVDGDFNYATSVYSTDVNGDGYMDILGAADDDDITWWENVDGLAGITPMGITIGLNPGITSSSFSYSSIEISTEIVSPLRLMLCSL
ncbi:MAG: hypothetical protein K8S62_09175 [Candidatus Sabulitectum sp.]|nr:hypothetical protein [Candidatus Sabulitectum sp.]